MVEAQNILGRQHQARRLGAGEQGRRLHHRASGRGSDRLPGIRPIAFGHVGDGNIHFNLTQPDGADTAAYLARREEFNGIVHDIVLDLNGSISAEHGIGRLKRDELAHYKRAIEIELMRRVKHALDPGGIMNPGKLVSF